MDVDICEDVDPVVVRREVLSRVLEDIVDDMFAGSQGAGTRPNRFEPRDWALLGHTLLLFFAYPEQ